MWFLPWLIGGSGATKLYLRNTQTNGIGANYYDLITTVGASPDTAVVNSTAAGTEIQFTKTAGGAVAQWISGRVSSGFTLTSTDISLWLQENDALTNLVCRLLLGKKIKVDLAML